MAFGHVALLDGVNLILEKAQRVALIGRNGEGKSTLLKIILGELQADKGLLEIQQSCRIAMLAQSPTFNDDSSVFQAVASALGKGGDLVARYNDLLALGDFESDEMGEVQHQLEVQNAWGLQTQIDSVLSRLQLDPDALVRTFSGGWQRRVALAQALVQEPDCLLLDEPTNHLDIEAIEWLETKLKEFKGNLLFISHDRRFVQNLATRIIELDRGVLRTYPSDYATYLQRKQKELADEAVNAAKFDKRLAQEEVWIRQGIKARRTRNEGRVRALKKLREQHKQRRSQVGKVKLNLEQGQHSGKVVIETKDISQRYGDNLLFEPFSNVILRGDKVGFIGPNGAGKTTLLKIILKQIEPTEGEVKHGTGLQIAYFDQLRDELDLDRQVFDAVADGNDTVTINGKTKHVMSYLADFLFAPERARSPIRSLSGGERNRLLLARLFTKPANLLVMDEPTNDLDVESLELLEELLVEYQGTLLLISHDRSFLDNVVTSTLVFEDKAQLSEYVGGYQDYLRQRKPITPPQAAKKTADSPAKSKPTEKPKTNSLPYKQQQELAKLPSLIEKQEAELEKHHDKIADSAFYQQGSDQVNKTLAEVKTLETDLAKNYARWDELEQ